MTISSFIGPEGQLTGGATSGLSGRFLVAMPQPAGTDAGAFTQSVVLICSHDDEHAFGLVVNKPIGGLYVADIVSEMAITPSPAALMRPVHFGGPVDMQRGALLHSLDYRAEETLIVGPGIGLTATRPALKAVNDQDGPREAVLFMGHAGWDAGQLEEEIKQNAWIDADLDPNLIFGDPQRAWADALASVGTNEVQLSASAFGGRDLLPN